MLTRCPACSTIFRITPEQIKVRAGRVRCGQCEHAFNALDTLIEDMPASSPQPMMEVHSLEQSAALPDVTHGAEPVAGTGVAPEAIVIAPEPESQLVPPSVPESEPLAAVEPSAIVEQPEPLSDGFLPPEVDQDPRRWLWITGGVVAILVLALQAVLAFRIELAVLMPEVRPAFSQFCKIAGCEIRLPSKIELLSIEASDLHPDTEKTGHLGLVATIKNRAPFPQSFPYLELTLTDSADKAIVRKILKPADYLPAKASAAAGMAANADLSVSVDLDPGDLPASGYRLYLFYP